MRPGIATSLIVAALLGGCGSDGANTTLPTNAPTTPAGAAGGAAATPPAAMTPTTTPTQPASPPAAMNNNTTPTQPPANMPPPAVTPPGNMVPGNMPPAAMPPGNMPTAPMAGTPGKIEMDTCGIDTKWPGDEFCIKAPPKDKGFQMHIGPSNYENPEARYVLQPGGELTENFTVTSGNESEIYYYWRQYRMRPGSHHLIVNAGARRVGGSSNSAKDNPEAGIIAPENKGVGMPLGARTALSNSLHYFNFTDKPIIKEVFVNFWYRDKAEVTEPTREVFSMLGMGIAPGQRVLKHGACSITQPGRILTIYGHVHSHTSRFSVWRKRGSEKMLIHEAYDWEHPNVSEFSSIVKNPPLGPGKDGGFSGVMDLKPGDVVEFECDITNNTNKTFLGLNEAEDDEMCILIGDTVGAQISPACTASDLPASAASAR